MKRVILYGGSFNPPGSHHVAVVKRLISELSDEDRLIIVPCGIRPDKASNNDIHTLHRTTMIQLAFGSLDRVEIDLTDLESGKEFTRTVDLDERYRAMIPDGEIWHVVGKDLITGGANGTSEIQTEWHRGDELWDTTRFLVLPRGDALIDPRDLPPNSQIIEINAPGSSSEIRTRRFKRRPIKKLVPPAVYNYIERYRLYTGRVLHGPTEHTLTGQPMIVADDQRPATADLIAAARAAYADRGTEPIDHIIVIGGDGFMLDAIAEYAHLRLPMVGLNAGTLGFLLNDGSPADLLQRLKQGRVRLYQQPLLVAEATGPTRMRWQSLAFNELFLKADNDQAAWMQVHVDGTERFVRLEADGLMVSTAAGSTGWAHKYGTTPIMIGTPMLLLTGVGASSNGRPWNGAPIGINSVVDVTIKDVDKRPVRLLTDGRSVADVKHVSIRTSRTIAVELGFFPETDLAEKLSRLHFPT